MADLNEAVTAQLVQQGLQQGDMQPLQSSQTSVTNAGPTSTTSQSTTQKVMPEGYQQAVDDAMGVTAERQALAGQMAQNQQRIGQVEGEIAQLNIDRAAEEARIQQEEAARRAAIEAEGVRRRQFADEWFQREQTKLANMKPTDFWESKGTGARILGAIAVGLGALGAGLARTDNYAMNIIQKEMDAHNQRERDAITGQRYMVELAQQGNEGARRWLAESVAAQNSRESARWAQVARQYGTLAAAKGATKQQIASDQTMLSIVDKAKESEEKAKQWKVTAMGMGAGTTTSSTSRSSGHSSTTSSVGTVQKSATTPKQAPAPVYGQEGKPIGQVASQQLAEKVNGAVKNYREAMSIFDALKKSYAKGFQIPVLSDEYQRRESLTKRLYTIIKNQEELGALSGPDEGLLRSQISSGLEMTTGKGGAKLDAARAFLRDTMVKHFDSVGMPGKQKLRELDGAPAAETPAAQGVRKQLSDGRMGTLMPDGVTFVLD